MICRSHNPTYTILIEYNTLPFIMLQEGVLHEASCIRRKQKFPRIYEMWGSYLRPLVIVTHGDNMIPRYYPFKVGHTAVSAPPMARSNYAKHYECRDKVGGTKTHAMKVQKVYRSKHVRKSQVSPWYYIIQ